MTFTAWQLIGWEGDCGNVKLARLEPGPREVCQWVKADTRLEIVKLTETGKRFLAYQGLT